MSKDERIISNDLDDMRKDRDKYYYEAQATNNMYNNARKKANDLQQQLDQLEADRQKTVSRDKYERLKQDHQQLESDFKRAQSDLRAAQDAAVRRQQQMQQEIDQLRRDVANFSSEKKTLAWQLQAAKEREQALMQLDQRREVEIQRYKDLANRLRQGGAGAPAANQEFADPEPGDPPDYKAEERIHNHRKVIPDSGEAYHLAEGWQLIGASRRGRGHELNHKYRDDDFAVQSFGGGRVVVVAIADGLGSKPFSRWGARAAVNGAVEAVVSEREGLTNLVAAIAKQQLPQPAKMSQTEKHQLDQQLYANQSNRDTVARDLIERMLRGAHEMVERKARDERKAVDDLHSTLLVYIAVPHDGGFMFFASAQVGDGAVRSLLRVNVAPGSVWTLQEQPQLNGIDNEVQPFMRFDPSRYRDLIHITDLENAECIIGMTDGTLDDIEGGPDENGLFKGMDDFYNRIRQQALTTRKPAEGLYDFLGYRKRASFDDRTLVCLYRGS